MAHFIASGFKSFIRMLVTFLPFASMYLLKNPEPQPISAIVLRSFLFFNKERKAFAKRTVSIDGHHTVEYFCSHTTPTPSYSTILGLPAYNEKMVSLNPGLSKEVL